MLAWFKRLAMARGFAERIRRHHVIVSRPHPGDLIREAIGLAPRRLTLARFLGARRAPSITERPPNALLKARPMLRPDGSRETLTARLGAAPRLEPPARLAPEASLETAPDVQEATLEAASAASELAATSEAEPGVESIGEAMTAAAPDAAVEATSEGPSEAVGEVLGEPVASIGDQPPADAVTGAGEPLSPPEAGSHPAAVPSRAVEPESRVADQPAGPAAKPREVAPREKGVARSKVPPKTTVAKPVERAETLPKLESAESGPPAAEAHPPAASAAPSPEAPVTPSLAAPPAGQVERGLVAPEVAPLETPSGPLVDAAAAGQGTGEGIGEGIGQPEVRGAETPRAAIAKREEPPRRSTEAPPSAPEVVATSAAANEPAPDRPIAARPSAESLVKQAEQPTARAPEPVGKIDQVVAAASAADQVTPPPARAAEPDQPVSVAAPPEGAAEAFVETAPVMEAAPAPATPARIESVAAPSPEAPPPDRVDSTEAEPVVGASAAAELPAGPVVPAEGSVPEAPTGSPSWQPIEERRARPPARGAKAQRPDNATRDPRQTTASKPAERPNIEEILAQPEEAAAPPSEWLARLHRALGVKPADAGESPAVQPDAEPVSLANREAVKPVVGVDPATVEVLRGPAVAKAVSALNAEAVTIGNKILMGEGHPESDPKTAGLLAHEMVHVARGRDPRFVPPVVSARREAKAGARRFVPPMNPAARGGSPLPPPLTAPAAEDQEEAMALEVEAEATSVARESRTVPPTRPGRAVARAKPPFHQPAPAPPAPSGGAEPPWGSLPAPWEPLPDVFSRSESVSGAAAPVGAADVGGAMTAPAVPAPAVARRAAPDRTVPDMAATAETPGHQESGAPVDLDSLAKQVYGILKRRLAGERRRAL